MMLQSGESAGIRALNMKTGREVKARWESSNPSVVRINPDGTVTAVSCGEAVLTSVTDRSDTLSCLVSVDVLPQNPVLPPSWGLYITDPEPKVFKGRVYVYGSTDVDNGILPSGFDWGSERYNVLYSEDLLQWADAGTSFHLDWIPDEYRTPEVTRLWAPDVLKHPVNGKYYLYSCFNQKKGGNIMVSVSDRPEGPFLDAIPLLIDGEKPIDVIDPAVLVDDDGRAYVTWPFTMGQLDPEDYTRVLGNTLVDVRQWMPEDNPPFEGPSLRKRGDTYYYIYIQNDGLMEKPDGSENISPTRMAYLTSRDPLGPYTYGGLIISSSDYPNAINIHGSIVEFEGNWYVFYHLPVIDKEATRAVCIERLNFRPDGSIVPVELTSSGIRDAFRPGERIPASGAVVYPSGGMNPVFVSRKGNYPKMVFSKTGSYVGYKYVDLTGTISGSLTLSAKVKGEGGIFEIRLDAPEGPILAVVELPDTDGDWQEITREIKDNHTGKHSIYVILKRKPEKDHAGLEWVRINTAGHVR